MRCTFLEAEATASATVTMGCICVARMIRRRWEVVSEESEEDTGQN